jgi:hypothetical protein
MAENRRDVNLVIRAKDEASRAFEQATTVLEQLVGINTKVGTSASNAASDLAKLAEIAVTLDKVYTAVNGSAERAATGFSRQQTAIAAQRNELAALQAQAKNAQAAIERLNGAEAVVAAGRNQQPRLQALQQVTAEYNRLEQAQQRLKSSIAIAEAELNSQRSSLQQIGSTATAVEQAQNRLASTTQRLTTVMQNQAKAASVLQTIERNTGLTNRDSTDYQALVGQIHAVSAARDEEIARLKAEEAATAAVSRAKEEQARINQLLNVGTAQGKSAQASAAVFQQADVEAQKKFEQTAAQAAQAAKEEEAAIASLRAEINPLAVAEQRAAAETAKLDDWFKRGKITQVEYAVATKSVENSLKRAKAAMAGIDSRGRPSLFGLKPYELQNLSFQVNDIITQLASGTSLSQTLAQQSGQLIQLFPQVGNAVIAAFKSPPILAFAAAVGTVALGLHEVAEEAARLRALNAVLELNADGALHSAEGLAVASKAMQQYGISAEEALAVTKTLIKEGFDDSQVVQLGESSKILADVLGIKVTDAAQQVADAFRGSYDSIKKLDDATNFLSAAQREHIKTLFEQGKVEQARQEALRIFEQKMEVVADKMRGPWHDATISLGVAWQTFKEALANNSVMDQVAGSLDKLGRKTSDLINKLRGIRDITTVNNEIKDVQERIDLRNRGGAGLFGPGAIDFVSGSTQAKDEQRLNELLHERSRILSEIGKQQDASGNASKKLSELQQKQNADLQAATEKLKAQGDLTSDRTKLQIEYNEALLEAQRTFPNSAPELQRQYALTKQKMLQIQLDKQHAAEAKAAADQAERERKERERLAKDPIFQSVSLIKSFEGFSSHAKIDSDGRFRAGFGSDTFTRQDGSIGQVTSKTVVTLDDAVRDLERRVVEFQNVVKQQIGAERFAEFSARQQAALTSIAYNYGKLPDRIVEAVKHGTSQQIATAVQGLAGDNGGINAKRRNKEAAILGVQNLAVDQGAEQALADIEAERLRVQTAFNEKLKEENDTRRQDIAQLEAQKGLVGDALLAEQKKEFVADAILKKQQEIDKLNAQRANEGKPLIQFTEEQKKAVGDLAATYFDLAHAKDAAANARDAVQQPLDALQAQKEAIQAQIDFFRQNGQDGMADRLLPQLDAINSKLKDAIQNMIKFWQSVLQGAHGGAAAFGTTNEAIKATILALQGASEQADRLTTFMGLTAESIAHAFTGAAVSAIEKFAQAVAGGANVFKSLKEAFLQFASEFLLKIAEMILQQIIFNAVMQGLKAIGIGVPVAHTGGVVGRDALASRTVSPMWFANARRYHTGGIAGLKPDEVPAILKQGEEVLTAADPRHRANGGGNGKMPNIKIVNAIDAGEFVSQGIGTAHGERAILNWMRGNAGAIRQALG